MTTSYSNMQKTKKITIVAFSVSKGNFENNPIKKSHFQIFYLFLGLPFLPAHLDAVLHESGVTISSQLGLQVNETCGWVIADRDAKTGREGKFLLVEIRTPVTNSQDTQTFVACAQPQLPPAKRGMSGEGRDWIWEVIYFGSRFEL